MKTRTRSFIPKQGFTLPEVVITSLLIVMMMLPVSRIAFLSIRGTQYARDAGDALAAGQQKLESFSNIDYDTIAEGQEVSGKYTLAWTVDDEELDYAKVVRMEVTWTILGSEISIDLNTVYTSPIAEGFSFD